MLVVSPNVVLFWLWFLCQLPGLGCNRVSNMFKDVKPPGAGAGVS